MSLPKPIENKVIKLTPAEKVESTILHGDLTPLSAKERIDYAAKVCNSLGLNGLTNPLQYIRLNKKLTLYATKDAAAQLRSLHGISITHVEPMEMEDVYIVKVSGHDKTGRQDTAMGAVCIGGLRGDHLANAVMKAESKAKRRLSLSLAGLGFLDVDDVELAQKTSPKSSSQAKKDGDDKTFNMIRADIGKTTDMTELQEVLDGWAQERANLPRQWAKIVDDDVKAKLEDFGETVEWGDG